MMNKYLIGAIRSLRPTAEFSFVGDDYSTIKWDILEGKAPTKTEIDKEIAKIKSDEAKAIEAKQAARQAILEKLGLTADEAQLLLG